MPGNIEAIDEFLVASFNRARVFLETPRVKNSILTIVLVVATIITYRRVWNCGFTWDDAAIVSAGASATGPSDIQGTSVLSSVFYYPVVQAQFSLVHAVFGPNPRPFHLLTLLAHVASAVLLWRLLLRLNVRGAWFGATFWALHPIQTASVAWIAQLRNTEVGLLFLGALMCFVLWRQKVGPGGSRFYVLALLCAALGIFTGPWMVVLPFVIWLCWWWLEGRWNWRHLPKIIPFCALSIVGIVYAIWAANSHSANVGPFYHATFAHRLAIAGKAFWFYAGKVFWPYPLSFIYPRWPVETSQPLTYLPLALVVLCLFGLWPGGFARLRPLFFAFAFFLIALLPALGVFNLYFFRFTFVADQFAYIASIAPLALTAALLACGSGAIRYPLGGIILSTVLSGALAFFTRGQSKNYSINALLWKDTLAQAPAAALPYHEAGRLFVDFGDAQKALPFFKRSIEIDPHLVESHNAMGLICQQFGRTSLALGEYEQAVQVAPGSASSHYHLGAALLEDGRIKEGLEQFSIAAALAPKSPELRLAFGNALARAGRTNETLAQFQEALRLAPHSAQAQIAYASAMVQSGHEGDAVQRFMKIPASAPEYVTAQDNLGYLYLKTGRVDDAMSCFLKATSADTNHFEAYNGLGCVLVRQGKIDDAIKRFHQALDLSPEHAETHFNLAQALNQQGRSSEATFHFRKAVVLNPAYTDARVELGNLLINQKFFDRAAEQFQWVLGSLPNSTEIHYKLGLALQGQGKFERAVEQYHRVLELDSHHLMAQNNLAWILATCPKDPIRNGAKAVSLAEGAEKGSGDKDPRVLDTLAAAYAEAGDFAKALELAERAKQLAGTQTNTALVDDIRRRISLYQEKTPYRD
jgi:tetratricopeptide (TPR) repeat protein